MKKIVFFVALLLLNFCILNTSQSLAQIEQTSEALKRVEKNVRFKTLSNGLRVIIYPRHIAPVFSGVVVAKVGGADEPAGKSGIAHMLEHMAFKGTKQIGTKDYYKEAELLNQLEVIMRKENNQAERQAITDQLRQLWITDHFTREYDKRGANGLNAYTTAEITAYYVDLPKSAFEFWCYMESERLLNPVMRQFYEERDVVLEERRMRFGDDPEGKLYESLLSNAYSTHPYGKPVIGFENELRNLTATDVKQFHDQYYIPSELVVSIAGDIDVEKDLELIEKYFGRLPASDRAAPRPTATEPEQKQEKRFSLSEDSNAQTMIAYHKPVYPDAADPVISVLTEVLTGSRLSPLRKKLVEEQKIAISVSASEAPGNRYPNLLIFSLAPKTPHSNNELIIAFDKALEEFKAGWHDAELLENAKRSVAMNFLANLKSNQGIALGLASDLATFDSWKASSDWFKQAMLVDINQLKDAAAKYLISTNRTVGTIEKRN